MQQGEYIMFAKKYIDDRGFSLIELIVGLFVAMLILAVSSTAFILQNRTADVQQDTSEMQLEGQVAMEILERDLRMAGYGYGVNPKDPALTLAPGVVIPGQTAGTGAVFIDYVRIDPDPANPGNTIRTNVRYLYFIEDPGQGVPPAGPRDGGLTRTRLDLANNVIPAETQTIASNVQNMRVANVPYVSTANPVTVTLLVRSPVEDPKFVSATAVEGFNVPADHFRRRAYASSIIPRNFGL